jgi:hypothetical protein
MPSRFEAIPLAFAYVKALGELPRGARWLAGGTGQVNHQRRAQRLRGWRPGAEYSKDGSPASPGGRASHVIT